MPDPTTGRPHLLKGAMGESLVTLDLMERGFEVYKAYGNFSCDLIARKHGVNVAIEVKYKKTKGAHRGPVGAVSDGLRADRFDVLANVRDDKSIVYQRSKFHQVNSASKELTAENEAYHPSTVNKYRIKIQEVTGAFISGN